MLGRLSPARRFGALRRGAQWQHQVAARLPLNRPLALAARPARAVRAPWPRGSRIPGPGERKLARGCCFARASEGADAEQGAHWQAGFNVGDSQRRRTFPPRASGGHAGQGNNGSHKPDTPALYGG